MKKSLIIFILVSFLFSGIVFAETSNTGFIPGQIWYSKQPLIEGETVDIHTIVWNEDINPLSATIEFYDKNVVLGSRNIIIPSKTSKDVSISWKVTAGDHLISASITSSKITTGNTSQSIILKNRTTEGDKQFVSKVIENVDGTPVSSGDIIKNKVVETTSQINNIFPESISVPVSDAFNSLDDFRSETYTKIESDKLETQKKLDTIIKKENSSTSKNSIQEKPQTGISGTEKPITYVKIFFLSILSFIFGHKIIFYLLCALLSFIILRFFYRKIRGR